MKLSDFFDTQIIDENPIICSSYRSEVYRKHPEISCVVGDIFRESKQLVSLVSPANAFGNLRGGIDAQYLEYFGDRFEKRVQAFITHLGGRIQKQRAIIIPTYNELFPYVILSPTVEYPGGESSESMIFDATRAALSECALFNHYSTDSQNRIKVLRFPGMGTGCAALSPKVSARAFARAYEYTNNNLDTIIANKSYTQ